MEKPGELKPISVKFVPVALWERFRAVCRKDGRSVTFMFLDMLIKFLKSKEK